MHLDLFHFLLSDQGQAFLSELGEIEIGPENHLSLVAELRQKVSREEAGALVETALLRQRARVKFDRAAEMYFTRQALEQASAEVVARYRAGRYAAAGFKKIADLGCGIGGDSLALAQVAEVIGVEWDPLRLLMAQENVRVYAGGHQGSLPFRPLQADLTELSPLPVEALFADPGRRDELDRRIYSVYEYRPSISFLQAWRDSVPHQAIKVSPGVDYAEIPDDCQVEFISVKGEVREGVFWFGDLRTGSGPRATLLPEGYTLAGERAVTLPVDEPRQYLYEPDGAVIRAHLVEQLGQQLGAGKIDDDIAYLTAGTRIETPFARCYQIDDFFPFQLKRLRGYLRERQVGQVVIKKRGSPIDPDELRRRLRLQGEGERVIFLTKVRGQPTILVGRPDSHDG